MKLEQANIIAAGKSLFNLNDTIPLKSSEVYASSSAYIPKKGVEIESFFPPDYHSHLLQECYVNMQTAEIHDRPDEYTPLNSSPVNEIRYPDDENDEDEDTKLDVEEEIGALHTYLSDIDHDVKFMRMIEASLEMAYYTRMKNNYDSTSAHHILDNFKKFGENKKEIVPGCGIYFPTIVIEEIQQKSEVKVGETNWKELVKLALLHVYGDSLTSYTAKGRLSSRPGLETNIQKAILVGENDLQFFRKVIKTVEKACENYKKSLSPSRQLPQLPEEFTAAKKTHTKISPSHEIYLPMETAAYVVKRSKINGRISRFKSVLGKPDLNLNSSFSDVRDEVRTEPVLLLHEKPCLEILI
ncbi:hypothetical protein PV325_007316 [Microctonus aethiopoides]|nr:hypothetical protein PV325_007316 [Microctonus aethiopoides]